MSFLFYKIGRTYIINILMSIVYTYTYKYIHINYLSKDFGYFGYSSVDINNFFYTIILSVLPVICFSSKKVPSNFISVFVYIFMYIPTMITMQYSYIEFDVFLSYQIVFFVSMTMLFLADKQYRKNNIKQNISIIPIKFWLWFGIIITIISIFSVGFSSMRLVSLTDVYVLRSDNSEATGSGPVAYFFVWISKFFVPLFITIGLVNKKREYIIISILMALIVYMTKGSKATLFMPLICVLVYHVLKKLNFKYILISVSSVFTILASLLGLFGIPNSGMRILYAIVFMRTLSISGLLTTNYIRFFEDNPYTYYSHNTIVNLLTDNYPYNDSLGMILGAAFLKDGHTLGNANANFWATDGVAALGQLGVLLISIICFYLFRYLNNISEKHDMNFVFILLIGSIMSLLNTSVFTTLYGGGMILVIIFLRYSDSKTLK